MPVAIVAVVVAPSRLADGAEQVAADVGDPQRRVAELLQLGGRGGRLGRRRRSAARCSRCRCRRVSRHGRQPWQSRRAYDSAAVDGPS